jgi:hypothetical protein
MSLGFVLAALMCQSAYAENIAAVESETGGGQHGVQYFNEELQVEGSFNTASALNSIAFASKSNNDVYATSNNAIDLYNSAGKVLKSFSGQASDNFQSIAVSSSDRIYVADNTSQPGVQEVLEFNGALQEIGSFSFSAPISGLSVGPGNELFITTVQNEFRTTVHGAVLSQYNGFGADSFLGSTYNDGTVDIADNTTSGDRGVVEFDPTLGSHTVFFTINPITGIASDQSGNVFTSQGPDIVSYSSTGTLLDQFTGSGVESYSGIAVQPATSAPGPSAVLMFAAPVGLYLVRRRKGK